MRRSSFWGGTAYEGDKLAENMTLENGILKMPKEDNNSSHKLIEYEIGLTTETDYVPIKIIWKGQYPTIQKKNLEDEWEEVYDLKSVGSFDYDDHYYYNQIGSTVESVLKSNLGRKQEIPQDVFKYAHSVKLFNSTFSFCESLTSIPKGLFDNCPVVTSFKGTFNICRSLTYIPEGLFDHCPMVTNFSYTFSGDYALTGSTPTVTTKDGNRYKLWELAGKKGYPARIDGEKCFARCDKLTDIADIPALWKKL